MKPTIPTLVTAVALWLGQSDPQPVTHMSERAWSSQLASDNGLEAEHRLPDGSRIDMFGDGVAWEVEWADKWEQAFGQAAFYAACTDTRPGIWLLKKRSDDEDYLRCLTTLHYYRSQGAVIEFNVTEVAE